MPKAARAVQLVPGMALIPRACPVLTYGAMLPRVRNPATLSHTVVYGPMLWCYGVVQVCGTDVYRPMLCCYGVCGTDVWAYAMLLRCIAGQATERVQYKERIRLHGPGPAPQLPTRPLRHASIITSALLRFAAPGMPYRIRLRACRAMPSTGMAYDGTDFAWGGTKGGYGGTCLRACYAMPDTEVRYGATPCAVLRLGMVWCYGMLGTEVGYGAMGRLVLKWGMVLRDAWY
eukprot:1309847-Rhodomonas_salina.1